MKHIYELMLIALAVFICQSLVAMQPDEDDEEICSIPCEVYFLQEVSSKEQAEKWLKEYVEEQEKISNQVK